MSYLKRMASVLTLLAVAACGGGGGDPGTTPFEPAGVNEVVVVLSAPTISNSGASTVLATATALDKNRNAVADVSLTFAVDGNAISTPSATKTDSAGQVTTTISIGADRSNRTITVTAKSGSKSGTASLSVVDAAASNTASDIVLTLTSSTVANTGTATVTATAVALDAKRNALSDVAVTISADSGAVITAASKVTGANGTVTGVVGIGADRTNRDIIVTATSGSIVKTAVLKVVTDPSTTTPEASDLSLTLSAPSLTNGGSSTIVATATAVDSNRTVVAGIPITFTVDASAVVSVSGAKTDSAGQVRGSVSIGADRSNRVITVTATAGALSKSASFTVTGAKLTASASPLVIAGTTANRIEYTLVDFNAIAMSDQAITVTAPGLPTVTDKTDLNGKFTYLYTAPADAGTLQVSAIAAGSERTDTVTVSAGNNTVPVATEFPSSASVTPTPTVVTVNSVGSTTNQVELRALFIGANNKPVSNIRVRFDLAGNLTNTDGEISFVGNYVYSDSNGIARATFTPKLRSSPTNGITIRACYDIKDFASGPASACDGVPNAATATLTVSSEALAVSIRTNELIKEGVAGLTYIKEYVVMVVDSSGLAKPDVQITPSVDLTRYYKGFYVRPGDQWLQQKTLSSSEQYAWTGTAWERTVSGNAVDASCPNEDINRNGVREADPFISSAAAPDLSRRQEDLNWNGDLDPRKSDVAISMVGSTKTDSDGLAIMKIEYGKDVGSWIDYVITATASGVSGTESRARYSGTLPVSFTAVKAEAPPAFAVSPYGTSTVCTDAN